MTAELFLSWAAFVLYVAWEIRCELRWRQRRRERLEQQ
jgi:hypothetical protein